MKKRSLIIGYFIALAALTFLNACQDDPIVPNSDGNGTGTDTTWVNDSTDNNGSDSTNTDDGGTGEGTIDSTGTNNGTIDSTWVYDSLGG